VFVLQVFDKLEDSARLQICYALRKQRVTVRPEGVPELFESDAEIDAISLCRYPCPCPLPKKPPNMNYTHMIRMGETRIIQDLSALVEVEERGSKSESFETQGSCISYKVGCIIDCCMTRGR